MIDSGPAVVLEGVAKRYGAATIVEDLSFAVAPGEIVGFLGPNGAGKTTTLRMIAGYTVPSAGRIMVAGHDVVSERLEAARQVGYLPERPPLYDTLDVTGYLRFVAAAKGLRRATLASELERVVAACHLEEVARREIFKLSKGYRQRVGLAQALLGSPRVLLLDEPTAGLDPGQIQEAREVIRAFGRDHAVLFSTHILAEVTLICRRVAIIHRGRLLAIDSPAGLERAVEASHRVRVVVAGPADQVRRALLEVKGVTAVDLPAPATGRPLTAECLVDGREGIEAAIARAVATRWDLYRLERQQPTLETIFLRYVADGTGPGTTP